MRTEKYEVPFLSPSPHLNTTWGTHPREGRQEAAGRCGQHGTQRVDPPPPLSPSPSLAPHHT